jgi:hypothetical protein
MGDLSTPEIENVCVVCGNRLEFKKYKSDLVRGAVCQDCYSVEQNSWRRCRVVSTIILLLWFAVKILCWKGLVGSEVANYFPLWWVLVWFSICLLLAYRNLNKRRKAK